MSVMDGWCWTSQSDKQHYFENGRSLCGKYTFPTRYVKSLVDSDACVSCKKALKRREVNKAVDKRLEELNAKGRVEL